MNLYDKYPMKRGQMLVTVNGYGGEEDYYAMHEVMKQVVQPDDEGYSVDSMCIGGYFVKDGIRVRTSSESPYDYCIFFYDEGKMSAEENAQVEAWIEAIVVKLHEVRPK